ncbi:UNVERIFIED_CONTAM: hypothetical protein GTU68_035724, partial [Idotea baltica]|nr:hypothetical protein [Idotea baltica]
EQKISGCDAGADDYLTKPFGFDRGCWPHHRALLAPRASQRESTSCEFGRELNWTSSKRKSPARSQAQLSAKEFALLEFFMRNRDRVVDRITIAQKVWDINFEPTSNVIDVCISSLRKKVDRDFDRPLIHTVVGMGYRFGEPDDEQANL